jgi:hypothetical protein
MVGVSLFNKGTPGRQNNVIPLFDGYSEVCSAANEGEVQGATE